MKNRYLAISLLRLGDLLMHGHVLKSLAHEKNTTISILTHPFFSSIRFLFPFIDNAYLFEREWSQKSIGESHLSKSWAFVHIEKLLEKINSASFHLAIDLTHTEHSFRWLTFIEAQVKIGVSYNQQLNSKKLTTPNTFLNYLHSSSQSQYHFIDLFKKSLGLTLGPLPKGSYKKTRQPILILQTITSDIKKNWPIKAWKKLIEMLHQSLPESQIQIITSASDRSLIENAFKDLSDKGYCQIICTTLQETYSLLKKAHLLVTLDTAIKHLATWSGTPIIEISLGSSNPHETGAYQNEAIILNSKLPCSPCRHSLPCSMSEFICHYGITPELVLNTILDKLSVSTGMNFNSHRIDFNQSQYSTTVIYKVKQNEGGWFTLTSPETMDTEGIQHARRNQKSFEINN